MRVSFRRSAIRWGLLPLVIAGGAIGVALRELLTLGSGTPLAAVPTVIGINLVGSGLLGVLVGWLGDRVRLRAFLGTGVLGGFTSYSALAPLLSLAGPAVVTAATGEGLSATALVIHLLGSVIVLVAAPLAVAAFGFAGGVRLARRRGRRPGRAGA